MNLEQLTAAGAFVGDELISKEVSWTHANAAGEEVTDTFTIHVRRLPYGDVERMLITGFKEPDRSQTAQLLSEAVKLGEGGTEQLTYENAYRLEPSLARAMAEKVSEVNSLGGKPAKKTRRPTSSGAS